MKRVLIITYYWPPSGGAGVQRWLKFVKYFRNFGWEPVIYTPENPEYPDRDPSLEKDVPAGLEILRIPIWEPYSVYKKMVGIKKEEKISAAFTSENKRNSLPESISVWIRGNLFIPDARAFWIRPSIRFLSDYLTKHPVDAMVSTGPPHSMHLIALSLAEKHPIPWLADFRDPWTNIDYQRDLRLTRCATRKHKTLEKKVLQAADAVTVISPGMAADFGAAVCRPYEVVTNGYDPEDIPGTGSFRPNVKFSISHIGTLPGSRNPVTLWNALKEMIPQVPGLKETLEILLAGKVDYTVTESIKEAGLEPYLQKTGYLSHDEALLCQRQSQVLLLLINNTPNAGLILTGKFFEYLSSGRPILCIGPEEGDAARILRETGSGLLAGFGDTETLKKHLLSLFSDFTSGKQVVAGHSIEAYSRVELTRRMAGILDRLMH